jgi:hypothetical protein
MINPYIIGRPVLDPKDFYGRKEELKDIVSDIRKLNSVSLVGERGVGCTSLLRYISHPEVIEEYFGSKSYKFLYLDFAGFSQCSQTQFWGEILHGIKELTEQFKKTSVVNFLGNKDSSIMEVYKIVDNFSRRDVKLLFFLDGFDKITRNPIFDKYFFDNLRHFITAYSNVAYVTASKKNLGDLGLPSDVLSSPLFTYFTHKRIGFLRKEETEQLIRGPSKREGLEFNEEDVNFVFEVAYCHPLFVQSACHKIFKHRTNNGRIVGEKLKEAIYERIRKELYQNFENYFLHYWNSFHYDEKSTLRNLCRSRIKKERKRKLLGKLQDLCLIKEENGECGPFSSLLREFCCNQRIPKDPFR